MCDFERELQSPAPLADVDLPAAAQGAQGLTLEDLEQWHSGVTPETSALAEVPLDDLASELDYALNTEPPTPKVVKVHKTETEEAVEAAEQTSELDSASESNLEPSLEPDAEQAMEALLSAFQFQQGNQRYALNKRDDLRRLTKQSELLLQRLPQYLDRLVQVLHAQEQCQRLYDRLSDLSEKRGAAALIIQTARQIEVLEKNLKEKRFHAEELKKVQADLSAHQGLMERYQQIFDLMPHLELLKFD